MLKEERDDFREEDLLEGQEELDTNDQEEDGADDLALPEGWDDDKIAKLAVKKGFVRADQAEQRVKDAQRDFHETRTRTQREIDELRAEIRGNIAAQQKGVKKESDELYRRFTETESKADYEAYQRALAREVNAEESEKFRREMREEITRERFAEDIRVAGNDPFFADIVPNYQELTSQRPDLSAEEVLLVCKARSSGGVKALLGKIAGQKPARRSELPNVQSLPPSSSRPVSPKRATPNVNTMSDAEIMAKYGGAKPIPS